MEYIISFVVGGLICVVCQILMEKTKMMPGRIIADHSIIAGGCILTKDFPEWSIVGGNPSKLIKLRK